MKPEHVFDALERRRGGPVAEGNVGGGTGMICNGFKGGTGTASRKLDAKDGGYTVGVLVQCNYGSAAAAAHRRHSPWAARFLRAFRDNDDTGSIIVVVATDAPLLPSQLKRLARRVPLGLGRMGSYSGDGSGDIFIAFSTANPGAWGGGGVKQVAMLPNDDMNPLFLATVQCGGGVGGQRPDRRQDHEGHQRLRGSTPFLTPNCSRC